MDVGKKLPLHSLLLFFLLVSSSLPVHFPSFLLQVVKCQIKCLDYDNVLEERDNLKEELTEQIKKWEDKNEEELKQQKRIHSSTSTDSGGVTSSSSSKQRELQDKLNTALATVILQEEKIEDLCEKISEKEEQLGAMQQTKGMHEKEHANAAQVIKGLTKSLQEKTQLLDYVKDALTAQHRQQSQQEIEEEGTGQQEPHPSVDDFYRQVLQRIDESSLNTS